MTSPSFVKPEICRSAIRKMLMQMVAVAVHSNVYISSQSFLISDLTNRVSYHVQAIILEGDSERLRPQSIYSVRLSMSQSHSK